MKNDEITVGYSFDKMNDKDNKARPFLCTIISERTAFLCQTVQLPRRPGDNIRLEITDATGKKRDEQILTYNPDTKRIINNVDYPRLGWKYTIKWEE